MFATDCSQVVKMVSQPDKWPAFANYLEDIKTMRESFLSSKIIHVPRTHNSKVDSIAHIASKQSSFVVHMDAELPVWFTGSVWVCYSWRKKNIYIYKENLHIFSFYQMTLTKM